MIQHCNTPRFIQETEHIVDTSVTQQNPNNRKRTKKKKFNSKMVINQGRRTINGNINSECWESNEQDEKPKDLQHKQQPHSSSPSISSSHNEVGSH